MAVEQEKSCENIPINHAGCHIAISRANHTYFKPGVSEVSQWWATEVARHNTGFRFIPHGHKVLLVGKGGYLR
jgi:hypothetical protein